MTEINVKKITVIGGGNVGSYFMAKAASQGYEVIVYTSKPEKFSKEISAVDAKGNTLYKGKLKGATNDLKEAMDADLVFVTLPSFMFYDIAPKMQQYAHAGQFIGIIPGSGGAEFAFKSLIDAGCILFGLQRVPYVARLVEYGKTVYTEGGQKSLYLASLPTNCADALAKFMEGLFGIPCEALDNYLCVTMTPSNPILHTSRLATMFEDYFPGKIYEKIPMFYAEWDDRASKRLLACDREHQMMLKALDRLNLSSVKSLVIHYDNCDTPEKMTAKLSGILAFKNIGSPQIKVDGGWIPDFDSRYFTADFPFGLAIISDFVDVVGTEAENIKKTMDWYDKLCGSGKRFRLKDYGIKTIDDIYSFYGVEK